MSVSGPLPDTPKTYVDATLGHLASALDFGRLLAEEVAALEAERDRLRAWLAEVRSMAERVQDEPAESHHHANALAVIRMACERAEQGEPR